jgi:hypothetical protein
VRVAGQILKNAVNARWPMYVRNVKQLLRAHRGEGATQGDGADGSGSVGGFDERRYGFGGLMDLLRACQREELLRVERDRRGGLRVFPGQALQRSEPGQPPRTADAQPLGVETVEVVETESADIDGESRVEPIPIDTTAELLGRAKPRRPRTRLGVGVAGAPRGTRKPAARKPSSRRAPRAKKAPTAETPEDN